MRLQNNRLYAPSFLCFSLKHTGGKNRLSLAAKPCDEPNYGSDEKETTNAHQDVDPDMSPQVL